MFAYGEYGTVSVYRQSSDKFSIKPTGWVSLYGDWMIPVVCLYWVLLVVCLYDDWVILVVCLYGDWVILVVYFYGDWWYQ